LLKSVTHPPEETGDEYRTRTVGLACSSLHPDIRVTYHSKLTGKQDRAPPRIRAKTGDSLIDLTTLQMDPVEKSFTLEPRQLQRAIATGSFEITEIFDQSITKKSSRAVSFSTVGLSTNGVALEAKCRSKSDPAE